MRKITLVSKKHMIPNTQEWNCPKKGKSSSEMYHPCISLKYVGSFEKFLNWLNHLVENLLANYYR